MSVTARIVLAAVLCCMPSGRPTAAQITVPDSVRLLEQRAQAAYTHGTADSLALALELWHRALAVHDRLGNDSASGRILRLIGLAHSARGQYDSALAYYRSSLRRRQSEVEAARVLAQIGWVSERLGAMDSAQAHYEEALRNARTRNRELEGRILTALAHLARDQGMLDSALQLYRLSTAIHRELGDWVWEAGALTGMGLTYADLGLLESAQARLRQALTSYQSRKDGRGEAWGWLNIGYVYERQSRLDSAMTYAVSALRAMRANGDRRGEGLAYSNVGWIYHRLGRPDSAVASFRRALRLSEEIGEKSTIGLASHNIGWMHYLAGRNDSALASLQRALAAYQELRDRLREGRALAGLGGVYLALGKPDSALAYFRRGLSVQREPSTAGESLQGIGDAFMALERPDSALGYYRQALGLQRDVGDALLEGAVLGRLAALYGDPQLDDATAALAYFDSAAAVRASSERRAGSDPNRLAFSEQHVSLYADWSLAWLGRAAAVGESHALRAGLAAAERGRAQALLDLLRESSPGIRPGADLAAEGQRLVAATSGASTLSYLVTRDTLVAWLVTPSGELHLRRWPLASDSLTRVVVDLRAAVARGLDLSTRMLERGTEGLEDEAVAGAEVRMARSSEMALREGAGTMLPADLGDLLPEGSELIIVPHGVLSLVPFAALPVGPSGEALGSRYAVRYAPSLATLAEVQARPNIVNRAVAGRTGSALIVGNPRMPQVTTASGGSAVLASLPGADREGTFIAGRLGATLLTGAGASESHVRARMPNAPVVHLATHGFAFSTEARARNSFVALAGDTLNDGLLTVGEILDDPALTLTAELVVLSGCQTGLGDLKRAEGTVGLQRAFLAKGARSVLVSLWSVSDDVTAELMKRFYTHWLDDADAPSKAEALRRAQEDIRTTPGWEHPRFWAAFQLVGGS